MSRKGFLVRCFCWLTVVIVASVGLLYATEITETLLPRGALVGASITLLLLFLGMILAFFGVRIPSDPKERRIAIGFILMFAGVLYMGLPVTADMPVYPWLLWLGLAMLMIGGAMMMLNATRRPKLPKGKEE